MFENIRQFFASDSPVSSAPPPPPPIKHDVIYADRTIGSNHFIILRGADHRELIVRSTRDFVETHRTYVFNLPACQVGCQTAIIRELWKIPGIAQVMATSDELRLIMGVLHDRERIAPQVESTLIAWLTPRK